LIDILTYIRGTNITAQKIITDCDQLNDVAAGMYTCKAHTYGFKTYDMLGNVVASCGDELYCVTGQTLIKYRRNQTLFVSNLHYSYEKPSIWVDEFGLATPNTAADADMIKSQTDTLKKYNQFKRWFYYKNFGSDSKFDKFRSIGTSGSYVGLYDLGIHATPNITPAWDGRIHPTEAYVAYSNAANWNPYAGKIQPNSIPSSTFSYDDPAVSMFRYSVDDADINLAVDPRTPYADPTNNYPPDFWGYKESNGSIHVGPSGVKYYSTYTTFYSPLSAEFSYAPSRPQKDKINDSRYLLIETSARVYNSGSTKRIKLYLNNNGSKRTVQLDQNTPIDKGYLGIDLQSTLRDGENIDTVKLTIFSPVVDIDTMTYKLDIGRVLFLKNLPYNNVCDGQTDY